MKPLLIGILSAFFFAFTFILNRFMSTGGGSWAWSASLRYEMMLPILLLIAPFGGGLSPVLREIRRNSRVWLLWSFVGFVLFYAPVCFASMYGPAWLIASTWQLTIISGLLISPLLEPGLSWSLLPSAYRKVAPAAALITSAVIVAGVMLVQIGQSSKLHYQELLLGALPIIIASAAYPAGNRKLMQISGGRLNATQRVLAMTICSMPFWLLLSLYALVTSGPPPSSQLTGSLLVAVFSGVAATVLFFQATQMVQAHPMRLAGVEATQSFEVMFTLGAEVLFLSAPWPDLYGIAGLILVTGGMAVHAFATRRPAVSEPPPPHSSEIPPSV
ncbi:hypothetical protein AWM70_21905 [Paenibacillus yonginensis]|uniref:Multidrug resistance efflux transporter family protein n=1 Tax=Paenibacillus yonginensis TaxID=1462996 RepID=A0A1B1N686_9BACL|nr:multidrug resistance efflux transporter family protein [Paenibacillus yonginensis]ANS76907.1 hypothetical protein AWM70_21905 [Paenibacillus yonginensis]